MRVRFLFWILSCLATVPAHGLYTDGLSDKNQYSFERLEALLAAPNGPKTLESTLAAIQSEVPDLYSRFVLMYRSKSLQSSTFQSPRAIVFSPDAKFVMTFNGEPGQRGFDKLEIMQFRGDRFEFREVEFTAGGARVSAANPAACLRCHQSPDRTGADPRPNWEPYSQWPGAYGSDSFGLEFGRRLETDALNYFYNAGDAVHLAEAPREKDELMRFLGSRKNHPRYRFLGDVPWREIAHLPTSFTQALGELNFRRVIRLAKETPHFSRVQNLFDGVIRCGQLFASAAQIDRWEKLTPNEGEDFVVRKGQLMRERVREPFEIAWSDGGQSWTHVVTPPEHPMLSVSEGIFLLFRPFGVDITDWSMDFQTGGRLAFRERFGLPANVAHAIQSAYRGVDPSGLSLSCEQLRERALAEATALQIPSALPQFPAREPLLNRCIGCHGPAGRAPRIPFEDPRALKQALQKPSGRWLTLLKDIEHRLGDHATLDEQMPKGLGRVPLKDRQEFLRYLRGL